MKKIIRSVAMAFAVIMIIQFSSCAPSAKSVFKTEVTEWFESFDADQTVGKSKQVIEYNKDGSVAYEYPVTGTKDFDTRIEGLFNKFAADFAPVAQGDKLVMSYKLYSPAKDVYGLELVTKAVLNGEQREEVSYINFVKDIEQDKEFPEMLQKMAVIEASDRTKTPLDKDNVTFLYKTDAITVIDGTSSVDVPYVYVRPYLPELIKSNVQQDENIRVIDVTKKMVAVTYDDGPHGVYTKQLLDILEQNNAVATFYEVGSNLSIAPEQVKRASDMGCEIGSHTWSHANLQTSSETKIKQQLDDANKKFEEILGYIPKTLRPPYGAVGSAVKEISEQAMIGWSVDTEDWRYRNAGTVFNSVKNAGNLDGDVILLHSIHKTSIEASKDIIPWLIDNGYQLVTVSELMKYRYEQILEPGEFYTYNYFDNEPKTK